MTYSGLEAEAGALARALDSLQQAGERTGSAPPRIAIVIDGSTSMVVGALGALEAGVPFLALDPGHSPGRVSALLSQCAIQWLWSRDAPTGLGQPWQPGPIDGLYHLPGTGALPDLPGSAAVLWGAEMFSGTPGPRWMDGDVLAQLVANLIDVLAIELESTVLCASLPVDLHLPVALAVMAAGGRLIPYDDGSPASLGSALREVNATALFASVDTLRHTAEERRALAWLRNALTADHSLIEASALHQQLKANQVRWHNLFGLPDFTAVVACREMAGQLTRVGKLLPGLLGFILDDAGQPVPVDVPGTLYLAAASRASNADPLQRLDELRASLVSSRWRARWLAAGTLALEKPTGDEVILPHALIPARHVEALSMRQPLVAQCVLTRHAQGEGHTAWITTKATVAAGDSARQLSASLSSYLAEELGVERVPIGFVPLPRLPYTPAGEVDRDRLAASQRLDSLQRELLEQRLGRIPGIDRVVVEQVERAAGTPALDMAALLPESTPKPAAKPSPSTAPARETDAAPESSIPWAYQRGEPIEVDPEGPRTLPAMLVRAAERAQDGITYIESVNASGALEQQRDSYAELLHKARRIAGGLGAAGVKPGDIAILQIEPVGLFLPALWGCLWAGVLPLALKVPETYEAEQGAAGKFRSAWGFLSQPVVLSSRAEEPRLLSFRGSEAGAGLRYLMVEELQRHAPEETMAQVEPQDVALLQLTSGSTGVPKCIRLSHRSIVSHARASIQRNRVRDDDRFMSWLPLDHVGSLIMHHLRVVYAGCSQVHARTELVLGEPLRWLDILHDFRATDTWAPSFAFKLVIEALEALAQGGGGRWDLSAVRRITNGAEQVSTDVASEFLHRLAPYGLPADCMRPAFGMAEMCSAITHAPALDASSGAGLLIVDRSSLHGALVFLDQPCAEGLVLADLGPVNPGAEIRIVGGDDELLRERHIGRVQFRGDILMEGYLNNEEANRAAFVGDGWFNTGDLGFLQGGHLVLTGREKDVIRIRGVMFYCHEIEELVDCDGVEPTYVAAVSVWDERGEEALAVFFSPTGDVEGRASALADTSARIREVISRELGITPRVVVPVAKQSFPKTTSGKVQRAELRKRFDAGLYSAELAAPARQRTLPSWFFGKTWRKEQNRRGPLGDGRVYLVWDDGTEVAEALLGRLHGQTVRVRAGRELARLGPHEYCLQPGNRAHYEALLSALDADGVQPTDVVYLASTRSEDPLDRGQLERVQQGGVLGLLSLVQALAKTPPVALSLFAITRAAQAVAPSEPVALEHGALPGLLKTLPAELPWLDVCHIDLGHIDLGHIGLGDGGGEIAQVLAEIETGPQCSEVAFRGGDRLRPVFERLVPGAGELAPSPLRRGGLYLVTGGLGGIGVEVSRWLLQHVQARLVIIGRTVLPDRGQPAADEYTQERLRAHDELQGLGGALMYRSVDVADGAAVERAVSEAESRYDTRLAGVFHLAGIGHLATHWATAEEHAVAVEDETYLADMFRAKVHGTAAVLRMLAQRPAAMLVAFSSVNALFGGTSVGAYSAAGSFLDGACHSLRSRSGNDVRILNWTMWDDIGMCEGAPQRLCELSEARGFRRMSAEQGILSLDLALRMPWPQMAIGLDAGKSEVRSLLADAPAMDAELSVAYVAPSHPSPEAALRRAVMQAYPGRGGVTIEAAAGDAGTAARDTGRGHARGAGPSSDSERILLDIWREVLGRDDVTIDDDFFAFGGDSIKSVQVIARANKKGLALAPKEFLHESTVRALARVADEQKVVSEEPSPRDFVRDAVLAADIQAPGTAVVTSYERPFLTGATGFVGSFLLRDLVDSGCAEVCCLVRADSEAEGRQRIRRSLEGYGLWNAAVETALRTVTGDLSQPRLGLSRERFDELATRVDSIYHCGASVNLVLPYSAVKPINVGSIAWILRLASASGLKPVHYVSTLGVLAPGVDRTESFIRSASESVPLGGYLQSKWIAEKLLTAARSRGFPVSIYRLGRVTGHSERGVAKTDDYFHSLIKACLSAMRFPAIDRPVSFVPVDFISRAIVHLARSCRDPGGGKVFHLTNLNTVDGTRMLEWVKDRGYAVEIVPAERWLDEVLRPGQLEHGDSLYPFIGLLDEERSFRGEMPIPPPMSESDCRNVIEGLAGSDIHCPPVDVRLFNVYIDYFLQCGLMSRPEEHATKR